MWRGANVKVFLLTDFEPKAGTAAVTEGPGYKIDSVSFQALLSCTEDI